MDSGGLALRSVRRAGRDAARHRKCRRRGLNQRCWSLELGDGFHVGPQGRPSIRSSGFGALPSCDSYAVKETTGTAVLRLAETRGQGSIFV